MDVSVADGAIVDVYRKEDRRRSPHERNRVLSAVAVPRLASRSVSEARLQTPMSLRMWRFITAHRPNFPFLRARWRSSVLPSISSMLPNRRRFTFLRGRRTLPLRIREAHEPLPVGCF